MDWTQVITAVCAIIAANISMVKFFMRDLHKQQDKFESELKDLRLESKTINSRLDENQRLMNMRLDALYNVLLDKVYGNK
jgi:hypothetical protein